MKLPDLPRDGVPVQKTMVDVINYLRSITVTNIIGGKIKTSSSGTTLELGGRATPTQISQPTGAFMRKYSDGAGDTYLQCGTVTGGNGGSATVADYKVLDSVTGVGALADQILYLEVTCNATVSSGIMLPGCEVTAASLSYAATVPDNETFTAAAYTGKKLYLEIGRWTATTFLPSAVGNVLASGCIGNFSLSRV